MCEAAENLSHVSPGVLVTVKSMIYSMKNTLFLAICASKLTATIMGIHGVIVIAPLAAARTSEVRGLSALARPGPRGPSAARLAR